MSRVTRQRPGDSVQSQFLVIADPPHGMVDYKAIAPILGLAAADTRLKVDFPAPEVLMVSGREYAGKFAESVRRSGLHVAVIDGRELVGLPWPAPATSFRFGSDRLTIFVDEDECELPYDMPVVGIFCEPPADFPPPAPGGESAQGSSNRTSDDLGLEVAEAIEWMAVLDLYFTRDGEARRLSIAGERCDFSGLGDRKRPTPRENMAATVAECERRFPNIRLDRRLVGVRPRHRFLAGDTGFDMDMRKLFSFGTLLLRQALESISPELRNLTQYELGSRLAYVLSQQE